MTMPSSLTITDAGQAICNLEASEQLRSLRTTDRIALRAGRLELEDGHELTLAPALLEMLASVIQGLLRHQTAHISVDDDLVTPERAAEILGVTRPTVYAWQDRGILERRDDVAGRRMVPRESVLQRGEVRKQARDMVTSLETSPALNEHDLREIAESVQVPQMADAFRKIDEANAESRGASDTPAGSSGRVRPDRSN